MGRPAPLLALLVLASILIVNAASGAFPYPTHFYGSSSTCLVFKNRYRASLQYSKGFGTANFDPSTVSRGLSVTPELLYGLRPHSHLMHSFESFLPMLLFLSRRPDAVARVFLPQEFLELEFVNRTLAGFFTHMEATKPDAQLPEIVSVPHEQRFCARNLVVFENSRGFMQGVQGPFGRELFLRSCGVAPDRTPPDSEADVLIYRRGPYDRNLRFIANVIDLADSMRAEGLRVKTAVVPPRFCDQVRLLHRKYKYVISIHGGHWMLFSTLAPGATLFEVLPRWLHSLQSCDVAKAGLAKALYSFAPSRSNDTLKLRDWCSKAYGRVPFGDCTVNGRCTKSSFTPPLDHNVVYLTAEEIAALVNAVKSLDRGKAIEFEDDLET